MGNVRNSELGMPFSHLFSGLAVQLTNLTQRVALLEETAHEAMMPYGTASSELIKTLQNLDYLHQTLDDLANLAGHLGTRELNHDLSHSELQCLSEKLFMTQTKSLLVQGKLPQTGPLLYPPGEPHIF